MIVLIVANQDYDDSAYVHTILDKYNLVESGGPITQVILADQTPTNDYVEAWAITNSIPRTQPPRGHGNGRILDDNSPDLILEFGRVGGRPALAQAMARESRARGIETGTVVTP